MLVSVGADAEVGAGAMEGVTRALMVGSAAQVIVQLTVSASVPAVVMGVERVTVFDQT